MFCLKQYHRASHLLRSKNLEKKFILCNYLTVKCLFEANELIEALQIMESFDLDISVQTTNNTNVGLHLPANLEGFLFDDTSKNVLTLPKKKHSIIL